MTDMVIAGAELIILLLVAMLLVELWHEVARWRRWRAVRRMMRKQNRDYDRR